MRIPVSSVTVGSGVILIVALLVRHLWVYLVVDSNAPDIVYNDTVHSFLATFVCKAEGGFCHSALEPTRRTQRPRKDIRPGEVILTVPRQLQIWDLDALRDPFVQEHLSGARHKQTGNALDSGAFLAVYLARRLKQVQDKKDNIATPVTTENERMNPYLNVLPTYDDFSAFHPALWEQKDVEELLGKYSSTYAIVQGYRDMIQSEYEAFVSVSDTFQAEVSEKEYVTMRLNVMSRSFGTGPPGPQEARPGSSRNMSNEIKQYQSQFGVDLSLGGCRAMVPILDMYDHHARPNVEWRYQSKQRAFVIYATSAFSSGIPAGQEIMDSYGKYTDPHLFARFGFVNGDGSEYTQASIASLHRMLDVDMKQQFSYLPVSSSAAAADVSSTTGTIGKDEWRSQQAKELARYLLFDDGYPECIQKDAASAAYKLKQLKLQHLQQIANIGNRWILRMPPRSPLSKPGKSTATPITATTTNVPVVVPKFDNQNLKFDGSKLISTCRLMVLTEDDFGGKAIHILKEVIENNTAATTFVVERQSTALEFRALKCLARLSGMALSRYGGRTIQDEVGLLANSQTEPLLFGTRNWTATHLRLGEMQTLELIHKISMSGVSEMRQRFEREKGERSKIFTRQKPCPFEYSESMLL